MEKVVWSGCCMCAESRLEGSWSVKECWRTPGPELNQHRSNRVSFHTLFGHASKTGARWLSDQKNPGQHVLLDGSGY
jgi:hypothetical protein